LVSVDSEVVSIIVAVYNVAPYLADCVESVICQDYEHIEVVLVDDGSTDGSGGICDHYSCAYNNVRVVHKSNGGLSDARNLGLAVCSGQYVMFVDGDDIVDGGIVSYLLDLLKRNSADIAICEVEHIFESDRALFSKATFEETLESDQAICDLLYQKKYLPSACGKLYRSELFRSIKFPEGRRFEDVAVMGPLFDEAEIIAYGNAKLYGYVHRDNSITTSPFSLKDFHIIEICNEYESRFASRSPKLKKAIRAYKTNCALRVLLSLPEGEYRDIAEQCKRIISRDGLEVVFDGKIRAKLRAAVLLYYFCPTLLVPIHQRVNRWA